VEFGLYSAGTEPGHGVTGSLGHWVTGSQKSDPVPCLTHTHTHTYNKRLRKIKGNK